MMMKTVYQRVLLQIEVQIVKWFQFTVGKIQVTINTIHIIEVLVLYGDLTPVSILLKKHDTLHTSKKTNIQRS